MLNIKLSNQNLLASKADGFVFFVPQDFKIDQLPEDAQKLFPNLQQLMEKEKFSGKAGQLLFTPVSDNNQIMYVFFAGLGKGKKGAQAVEIYRRAIGQTVRTAQRHKLVSLAFTLPDAQLFGVDAQYLAQQTATTLRIACYLFDTYISDAERKHDKPLEVILVVSNNKDEIQKGVDAGMTIGHAVNQTRYWIDLPPSTLTPPELADKAKEIADETGLKLTTFGEEKINEMGMGGLAAVSRGSHQDCRLVIMEYKVADKNAPTLAFVGKGITFDSGGLNLKPPSGPGAMETMKDDMSGASAVIGAMEAIAKLKPKVNVIGITPLSENLPSGAAAKPGDIVRFYNGKTAEIKNTDAEGRLVLADALSYTVKHLKPDAIVDIATLTGACMIALGPFFTGMFSEHEDLATRVEESAQRSGDFVWRLPLTDDYKKGIKSNVADICNINTRKYYAGGTTAACFLQHFVGDTPWVHLDIAGTAFDVPDISYYRQGATGAAVRLLVDLAINWQ